MPIIPVKSKSVTGNTTLYNLQRKVCQRGTDDLSLLTTKNRRQKTPQNKHRLGTKKIHRKNRWHTCGMVVVLLRGGTVEQDQNWCVLSMIGTKLPLVGAMVS